MQKNFLIFLQASLVAALLFAISSCKKEDGPSQDQTGTDLTEFSLSDGSATYTAWKYSTNRIYISVPEEADLTKLTASFKHNGEKVLVNGAEAESGKSVFDFSDFTKPVTFQVQSSIEASAYYTVVIFNLPVVEINTPSSAEIKDKVNWVEKSSMCLHETDGTCSRTMSMSIKGRGNVTWTNYPKKPYVIRMDEKTELFGMPAHKRWLLLAEYRGYIGNPMEAEMERRTESIEWCPSGLFVELVLNGVHKGMYYFCEQIRIDKNRINIKQLDPTDTDPEKYTGGYLLEYDNLYDEQYKFRSDFFYDVSGNQLPIMLKSPDENVPDCQFNYIKGFIHDMEAALYDDTRLATRDYAEYLDIESFIDCWLVWESIGNYEAYKPRSVYLYKGRDGKDSPAGTVAKLKCGPLWDQEIFEVHRKFQIKDAWYFKQFFKDPVFVARVKEKWPVYLANLNGDGKFDTSIYTYLQNMYDHIRNSAARDMQMWDNEYFSLEDDVETVMSKLPRKLNWMTEQINAL